MKPLATIESWFTKLGLAPSPPSEKLALQQLEELVQQTAVAGRCGRKPKYYTHPHGQYADFKDFDTERMILDFSVAFPSIPKEEIRRVVMHGIYHHYLR
jgi:hypothetical protein